MCSAFVDVCDNYSTKPNTATAPIACSSDGKSESRVVVQNPLAPISLPIAPPEIESQDDRDGNNQYIANHARGKARNIVWRILSAEDESASDTANAPQPRQRSRAERAPPLPADVVRLVRHDGGDGAVGAGDGDEDADVLAPGVLDEAHDGQPS